MAEYRSNQGTADQLPMGAAGDLNQNTPSTAELQQAAAEPQVQDQGASQAQPEPQAQSPDSIELAGPTDNAPIYQPVDEGDAFVTGPTTRPEESQTVGAHSRTPIPPRVLSALPLLQRAAANPGADPQLVTLVKFITREVGRTS